MDNHTATEQAYKNGYLKGYDKGLEDALDVTIVRCKDCKHWVRNGNSGFCDNADGLLGVDRPDDFCSYGERR